MSSGMEWYLSIQYALELLNIQFRPEQEGYVLCMVTEFLCSSTYALQHAISQLSFKEFVVWSNIAIVILFCCLKYYSACDIIVSNEVIFI